MKQVPTLSAVWKVALLTALVLPTLATWLYFGLLAGSESVRWIYAGSKVLQFSLLVPWMARVRRDQAGGRASNVDADDARLRPDGWTLGKNLRFGTAFALAAVLLGMAVYALALRDASWMIEAGQKIHGKLADMGAASPGGYLALSVFLALMHSGLEEAYWRWFVYGALRRWFREPSANALSSLGFMAHHVLVLNAFFPDQPLATVVFSLAVAFGGAAWAWMYERSGSLWGAWLSHALVDAGILAIGFELAFR